MKVCIIGARNLNGMTLMSIYTDVFEKYNIPYDVIYIDRLGIKENCGASTMYPFRIENGTRKNRFISFAKYQFDLHRFKKFAINIINKNKYDYCVLWIEEMAYLFADYMSKHYSGRYSVNIRDLWSKNRYYFVRKIRRAVKHSSINTVSSPEFIKYLPKADYLFVHSANINIVHNLNERNQVFKDEPIVITSIGTFRNDQYCFDLVDCFANDNRFKLRFSGSGSERMEKYCKLKEYRNVECSGAFNPDETVEQLKDASIINCAYGADLVTETTKIPIRIYYAVYCGIPILCTKDTEIEKFAKRLDAAITIPDLKKSIDIANCVFDQFNSIDFQEMRKLMAYNKKAIEQSHIDLEKSICKSLTIDYSA